MKIIDTSKNLSDLSDSEFINSVAQIIESSEEVSMHLQKQIFSLVEGRSRTAQNNEGYIRILAYCYAYGFGTRISFEKAFRLFKKIEHLDLPDIYFGLGFTLLPKKAYRREAERYFNLAAERGSSAAYCFIGMLHISENSGNISADYKFGVEMIEKAFRMGEYSVFNILATQYEASGNLKKTIEIAMRLLDNPDVPEKNKYEAIDQLALIYVLHRRLLPDGETYLLQSALNGDSMSQFALFTLLHFGEIKIEKNIFNKNDLLESSAAQGNPLALQKLGEFYASGDCGFEYNPDKAFECFKKVDSKYIPAADIRLAYYYLTPKYIDRVKACECILRAEMNKEAISDFCEIDSFDRMKDFVLGRVSNSDMEKAKNNLNIIKS